MFITHTSKIVLTAAVAVVTAGALLHAQRTPAARPITVMCVGDSLTWGTTGDRRHYGGYRNAFVETVTPSLPVRMVGRSFDNGTFHEGHGRKRVDELDTIVTPGVRDLLPDCVILLGGINDLRSRYSPEQAIAHVSKLLDDFHYASPRTTIYACTLLPVEKENCLRVSRDDVAKFNTELHQAANARPWVHVIELNRNCGLSDFNLRFDGVHPDQPGYDKIGHALGEAFVSMAMRSR